LALVTASSVTATAGPVGAASQPEQRKHGFGSNGPCKQASRSFVNPKWSSEHVIVYLPTGSAKAPSGGRCDGGRRPTIVIAHGTSESDPVTFEGLITHLVSNGNVVFYPTHTMEQSSKSSNYDAYYAVRDGMYAAATKTGRADVSRLGIWGHSFGGGMAPYLVKQAARRGWGRSALWVSIVAQADSLLVTKKGTRVVTMPRRTHEMTVSMEDDQMADNRLGIDIFESLNLRYPRKTYVRINSDSHGQPAIVADHTSASGGNGSGIDIVDYTLWRYADLLESCALSQGGCHVNLSPLGRWSDGTPVVPALVALHPVDTGPYPAALAECDAGYGTILNNDRLAYCGPTHI
jgi:hypothetical protein